MDLEMRLRKEIETHCNCRMQGAKKVFAGAESAKTVHQRRIAAATEAWTREACIWHGKRNALERDIPWLLPMTKHGSSCRGNCKYRGAAPDRFRKGQATEEKFTINGELTERTVISLIPRKQRILLQNVQS